MLEQSRSTFPFTATPSPTHPPLLAGVNRLAEHRLKLNPDLLGTEWAQAPTVSVPTPRAPPPPPPLPASHALILARQASIRKLMVLDDGTQMHAVVQWAFTLTLFSVCLLLCCAVLCIVYCVLLCGGVCCVRPLLA